MARLQFRIKRTEPRPSVVFDTYWRFAAERQAILHRRLRGEAPPWTEDAILRAYKFTNAYRASDRTSQYLIKNVIHSATEADSAEDVLFRISLFKIFNKAGTWELLVQAHETPTLETFDARAYDKTLSQAIELGTAIYSAAYIMPSGPMDIRRPRKHRMHLQVLEQMKKDSFFGRVIDAKTMRAGYELILRYPSFGPFLSYQFITDFNYSDALRFSEMEFVEPGPGARDGIRKCFQDLGDYSESDVIRWVADRQSLEFQTRDLNFEMLGGSRPLQLIDCQNLFCEVDKYSRVAHPEVLGISKRTRIKQKFSSRGPIETPVYPRSWKVSCALTHPNMIGQMQLL